MKTEQEVRARLNWLKSEISKEQNRGEEKLLDLLSQIKFADWILEDNQ